MLHFHDPLAGCLIECPSKFSGLAKLASIPTATLEQTMLELREIPGVGYHQGEQAWFVPVNLVRMAQRGVSLEDYEPELNAKTPSGLLLHEHQARTVTFFRQAQWEDEGVILGAAPSAGKTIATLQALWLDELLQQKGIIVGPHSSTPAWCGPRSDAAKHFGLSIQPISGVEQPDFDILDRHSHLYIHYDIIDAWCNNLVPFAPVWTIFDESHKLLHSSKRAQASYQLSLCPTIRRRILLSGSPLPRDRLAFYHQLAVAQPHQWQSGAKLNKSSFGIRYMGGQQQHHFKGAHLEFTGPTNEVELLGRMSGVFLRYTQDAFEDCLPEVEYHIIESRLGQDELSLNYKQAETDLQSWLKINDQLLDTVKTARFGNQTVRLSKADRSPKGLRLRGITECRKLLAQIKVREAIKHLPQLLQEHAKFVAFTWKVDSAIQIRDELAKLQSLGRLPIDLDIIPAVTGEMLQPDRDSMAVRFWESERALFTGTMDSSGISINELGAATGVLLVALNWTPDMVVQALLRVRRINNLNKLVKVYILVVRGTIDDHLLEVMQNHAREDQALAGPTVSTEGIRLVGAITGQAEREGFSLSRLCDKIASMEQYD